MHGLGYSQAIEKDTGAVLVSEENTYIMFRVKWWYVIFKHMKVAINKSHIFNILSNIFKELISVSIARGVEEGGKS